MSLDEIGGDTFRDAELSFLDAAARQGMPGYRPAVRDNGQIAWMVLEPEASDAMPRFTICRVAPCIIVRIEDADERRFVSVARLEDAIVIAQRAVCEANARRNVHPAPAMAQ